MKEGGEGKEGGGEGEERGGEGGGELTTSLHQEQVGSSWMHSSHVLCTPHSDKKTTKNNKIKTRQHDHDNHS